jgi:hypothetical protein
MHDVIEASYTGDILGHRRCRRAWAYEKHAGFQKYEQVQAMEGRLIHHAMEWMTSQFRRNGTHVTRADLDAQMERHFRVLWARGVRTAFTAKRVVLDRILDCVIPNGVLHPTVQMAIEGAAHTEYELRAVRRLIPNPNGREKLLLTGILDLVIQQLGFTYPRSWNWTSRPNLVGQPTNSPIVAQPNDLEIWDYKGSQSSTTFLTDYVIQLLTYASLYEERTGDLPRRCVLFFLYEPDQTKQLLTIEVDRQIVDIALDWTLQQVDEIQNTIAQFQQNPLSVVGGESELRNLPVGQKVTSELRDQCTTCARRFDCQEYATFLGGPHRDIDIDDVFKN